MGEICMIGIPEVNGKESRMSAHSMVGSTSCSLAKERKGVCNDEVRVNGVNIHRKHKKIEDTQKLKKNIVSFTNKDDVVIVEINKESIGFRKVNRNGISSMYNMRCDPKLGVGKVAVRRIPCACSFCIEQLDLLWDKN